LNALQKVAKFFRLAPGGTSNAFPDEELSLIKYSSNIREASLRGAKHSIILAATKQSKKLTWKRPWLAK